MSKTWSPTELPSCMLVRTIVNHLVYGLQATGFRTRSCKVFTKAVSSLGIHKYGFKTPSKQYRASRARKIEEKGEGRKKAFFYKPKKR